MERRSECWSWNDTGTAPARDAIAGAAKHRSRHLTSDKDRGAGTAFGRSRPARGWRQIELRCRAAVRTETSRVDRACRAGEDIGSRRRDDVIDGGEGAHVRTRESGSDVF